MSSQAAERAGRPRPPRQAALLFFAFSGLTALLQEVGWSDLLARVLGHGTASVSVVAAAFLAGLALGAAWGGPLAARSRHPLALYGMLETGIGLTAAFMTLLLPLLPGVTAVLFGPALARSASIWPLAMVAGVIFIPVTFLMGATLPVLSRSLAAGPGDAGLAAGRLNGVNAMGGSLGAVLALAVLPLWGTRTSLLVAAGVQIAVGLAAMALATTVSPPGAERRQTRLTTPRAGLARAGAVPFLLLLLAGMASLAAQVAWTRAFSWMLGSSVYTFGLVLASMVAGLGAGSWYGARLSSGSDAPRRLFARLEGLLGLAMLLSITILAGHAPRIARLATALQDRPMLFQAAGLGVVVATILLPAALMGAAFPVACRLGVGQAGVGRGVGRTMAWLTAGNVLGAILAGMVLPGLLGTRGVLMLAALVFGAVAWVMSPAPALRRLSAAGLGLLLAWATPAWDTALMAANPVALGSTYVAAARSTGTSLEAVMHARGDFLFAEEGNDALVTVRRLPGGHASLQINGRTEASTGNDLPAQILAAQVPLLHAESPRRVLVIGLASGVTAGSVLTRDPEEVVVAEISAGVRKAVTSGAFDLASGRPWDDPRVKVVITDARTLLLHDTRTYDLIASQPSHPWVAGIAGLYTLEFYDLVRRRLAPGGVFGQWVQGYGMRLEDLRQVLRTFIEVFPHAALYEEAVGGGDYFLVGARDPLCQDAASLLGRLTPGVRTDLARAHIATAGDLLARRLLNEDGLRAFTAGVPFLRDDRLRLAYTTPLSRWLNPVARQARLLESHRIPRLRDLDTSLLDGPARATLLAGVAKAEGRRRQDRQFLVLLEDENFARLATPAMSEVVMLVRAGLFRAAYGKLLHQLERESVGPALQLLAGDLANRLDEIELARIHYQAALALDPASSAAQAGLGRAFLRVGAIQEALPALEAAVAGDPARASAWSNLGVARRKAGDPALAEQAYRRALALDPSLSETWYNLGRLLTEQGRQGEAVAALHQGLDLAPGDCDLRRLLAEQTMDHREQVRLLAPCAPVALDSFSAQPPADPVEVGSPDTPAPQGSER